MNPTPCNLDWVYINICVPTCYLGYEMVHLDISVMLVYSSCGRAFTSNKMSQQCICETLHDEIK